MKDFSLWLEFEQYADGYPGPEDDPACDFGNIQVRFGELRYAANVWTFAYLDKVRCEAMTGSEGATPVRWLLPPDLLVANLDRETISLAIDELLATDGLPESWLIPDP
ncbi:hypothetical protein ACTJI2_16470 [Pseudoxanthomonas sp. 22568]|uniref:hypothetical protein n=1 Tax=Pseudoxanthomonas sp. 22568 TaxID=3453945 RepID=UPI003F82BEE5